MINLAKLFKKAINLGTTFSRTVPTQATNVCFGCNFSPPDNLISRRNHAPYLLFLQLNMQLSNKWFGTFLYCEEATGTMGCTCLWPVCVEPVTHPADGSEGWNENPHLFTLLWVFQIKKSTQCYIVSGFTLKINVGFYAILYTVFSYNTLAWDKYSIAPSSELMYRD